MQLKAKFEAISIDFKSGRTVLTFSTDKKPQDVAQEVEKIKDKELDLEAKVHRERRSLDANAYFHVLVGKIADALRDSKASVKNTLICRYGQPLLIDDAPAVIKTQIPPEMMREQESVHAEACGAKVENGIAVNYYHIYRNSREYDTREMSILIDGTVEEAKALGIETLTPDELRRMLEAIK